MSIQAVAWALEQDLPDSKAKLVLVSICNHADPKTGEAWPWISTIAREASISPRSVHRALPKLAGMGLIRVRRVSGKASRYYVACGKTPDTVAGVNTALSRRR